MITGETIPLNINEKGISSYIMDFSNNYEVDEA